LPPRRTEAFRRFRSVLSSHVVRPPAEVPLSCLPKNFPDPAANAEETLIRNELLTAFAGAQAFLKPRECEVLQLRFAGGLKLREIGALLGIGAKRVYQVQAAALAKLRARSSS
jgi:RNA polymerase sigma factor (sigma-70 family)